MLTNPISKMFWNKICGAPAEWFQSSEGKTLCAKMVLCVKNKVNRQEAKILLSLIRLSAIVDPAGVMNDNL